MSNNLDLDLETQQAVCSAGLDVLQTFLPLLVFPSPDYAAETCRHLRLLLKRTEKALEARVSAEIPGQTSLPLK